MAVKTESKIGHKLKKLSLAIGYQWLYLFSQSHGLTCRGMLSSNDMKIWASMYPIGVVISVHQFWFCIAI